MARGAGSILSGTAWDDVRLCDGLREDWDGAIDYGRVPF